MKHDVALKGEIGADGKRDGYRLGLTRHIYSLSSSYRLGLR